MPQESALVLQAAMYHRMGDAYVFQKMEHIIAQVEFLSGSTPIERLFICTVRSSGTGCSLGVNNEPPSDQKNTFALEWSRFGNISLKKYSESNGWIEQ